MNNLDQFEDDTNQNEGQNDFGPEVGDIRHRWYYRIDSPSHSSGSLEFVCLL